MEFRILGPLDVHDEGASLAVGGPRQRALLAALLLRAGEVVSVDRLCADLWGETPPATAAHTVQVYVSNLRRALGPEGSARLVTRAPGYVIEPAPDELDLTRFERLVADGRKALAEGRAERASTALHEALSLWRGPALPDLADEQFAQAALGRLEELRLAALEERVEADLARGRHAELVAEIERLVADHPLRERLRGQLMLALYRCGRQAQALDVYQQGRRLLVDELGIDPSPALQRLERSILQQDETLEPEAAPATATRAVEAPARSILLAPDSAAGLDRLVELAAPLARGEEGHDLILGWLVQDGAELGAAVRACNTHRAALVAAGLSARSAAFTSERPGNDLVRLADEQRADLTLIAVDAATLGARTLPADLTTVLDRAPCDVGVLVSRERPLESGRPFLVPFGGADHEWAALEVAAWLAGAHGVELRLLGASADPAAGRRDASRLLAHAALAVQQLAGVPSEPVLAPPGSEAALEAAVDTALVVVGLPDGWRREGLGQGRLALAREARPPALLVRRGLRPGGLAPDDGLTRFTWSLSRGPR